VIADHHLAMLTASGITPEHAAARGYETISDPRRLAQLGIAKAGQRTRGLLVPQLRIDGSTWGYQYRPDSPRERNRQIVKYETPISQRNGIDVPPGLGDQLGDPSVPPYKGYASSRYRACGHGAGQTRSAAGPRFPTSMTLR
jgi:hypothetical protein